MASPKDAASLASSTVDGASDMSPISFVREWHSKNLQKNGETPRKGTEGVGEDEKGEEKGEGVGFRVRVNP